MVNRGKVQTIDVFLTERNFISPKSIIVGRTIFTLCFGWTLFTINIKYIYGNVFIISVRKYTYDVIEHLCTSASLKLKVQLTKYLICLLTPIIDHAIVTDLISKVTIILD